jgi:hypothetical protein
MNNLESNIYKKYLNSIEQLLSIGMKMICFSSYGDLFTDFYSSSFDEMNHCNLQRGIFLKDYFVKNLFEKNDFFIYLILYSIKWRNEGLIHWSKFYKRI